MSLIRRTLGLTAAGTVLAGSCLAVRATAAPAPRSYPNCATMQQTYPQGVARWGGRDRAVHPVSGYAINTEVYRLNTRLDADKDGVACERAGHVSTRIPRQPVQETTIWPTSTTRPPVPTPTEPPDPGPTSSEETE